MHKWFVNILCITAPYEQRLITCWVMAFAMCVVAYIMMFPQDSALFQTIVNAAYATIWIAGGFHVVNVMKNGRHPPTKK